MNSSAFKSINFSNPSSVRFLFVIPVALATFTHIWNPIGFPDVFFDEGVYMLRAMHVLEGYGPEQPFFYDHPYFGQLFLGGTLSVMGYVSLLHNAEETVASHNHSLDAKGKKYQKKALTPIPFFFLALVTWERQRVSWDFFVVTTIIFLTFLLFYCYFFNNTLAFYVDFFQTISYQFY